jgi:hypothetical protein
MTFLKTALTAVAATGLLVSQAAAAAPVADARSAAGIEQSEGLGGLAAGSAPLLAAFAVFLAVGIVLLVEDDDEEDPVSP